MTDKILNDLSLGSHMRVFEIIFPSFTLKMDIAHKFFLRTLSLTGNLFGNGKNSLHDLEAIIVEAPAFHFETLQPVP